MEFTLVHRMLIALGLGLLIGLQREWADKELAGIRTMPLVALFGLLAGTVGLDGGRWIVGGGLIALALAVAMGDLARLRAGNARPGVTTELAVLVVYMIGVTIAAGEVAAAVVAGGATAILLHWKRALHGWVDRMGADDVRSVIRLALIGLVILPTLPNRTFGPYDVLNPFEVWLMVVLIVGISLAAYVAYRLLGTRRGSLLAGLLGGMISSTATTVTYARTAGREASRAPAATLVIVSASGVVFLRVMAEIALVAPGSLGALAPPLLALMGFVALLSVASWFGVSREKEALGDQEAPSELKAAIVFGLLYALVLLGVAAAREHFGSRGLYVVAGLSGLTDMDAITLSTARMMEAGRVSADTGWRMLVVSFLANMVFKASIVAALGGLALLRRIAVLFGLVIAAGAALLVLW